MQRPSAFVVELAEFRVTPCISRLFDFGGCGLALIAE